jgi:uncharacterized protein (TIGR03086 family)
MSVEPLQQAIQSTRSILAEVDPKDLDRSTPCQSWKVSDLINHIVGAQRFFTDGVNGAPLSPDETDYAAGDFVGEFDRGSAAAVAAFSQDGAMERMLHLPFGEMPGAVFFGLACTDTLVHGWDLAKATGQPTDIEPELAAALLAQVRPALPDAFRGQDGVAPFGPEQPAPDGASNADRLAAFLGRRV